MNERLNWIFPSLYVRRLFSTDIRVSCWFALIPFVICPIHGLDLGLTLTVFLLVSVFLHELAHVFAARAMGGTADEIHLSPVGGVAQVRPGNGPFGLGFTAAAGPLTNLLICLMTLPGWYSSKSLWNSLDPFVLPVNEFHTEFLGRDLCQILFFVNWISFLLNLLPVLPLDGGQILRAVLSISVPPELVYRTTLQIGLFVALFLLVIGTIIDVSLLVLTGTFVLMVNVVHLIQEDSGKSLDDTGFNYDFSAAYEGLESSNPTTTRQTHQGLLQRWRESRRLRREEQERVRRLEAEQQLDLLLAKVHETGLQSLSDEEQRCLRNCSELLRARPKGEES